MPFQSLVSITKIPDLLITIWSISIVLPFFMFLTFIFFEAWSLFSAPLGAISKDYANLVKAFITAVFWLSGIMWDPANVKGKALKIFLRFNPVTYLVNGYRNCFINKIWFWQEPKRLIYFAVITIILFVIGIIVYKRVRKDIPDVL